MTNLEPYNLVSNEPSISRDMSIVTGIDTDLNDIYEQIILNIWEGNVGVICVRRGAERREIYSLILCIASNAVP
ncbi:hypothetical protein ACN23B_23370 [Anabaena sp. FACHB-709]|uniref:Uncharacterized protein n=2 Tax=Nostocaceae TaxID=1162 RepID=A0A1Z4KMV3_ANAVA|nr:MULTISPECIES: hypothetical protein [Nostocaceae]BAY70268.1 hypothetical protein NIES23_30710 [Trichormus variabilis NIES-23]HBW30657.1 hypothetical protein [Nostoc sp. UBA8866]MBD2173435.1 hypothetical protein [Anabaena cylindrica FACHB-318]MBD2265256.1 hypothetical protein [Anabaena sp. FACHB-709]MBD2274496.1 hypothetical protein [Nostoc sp. PCC 7120 = FACHB-418]